MCHFLAAKKWHIKVNSTGWTVVSRVYTGAEMEEVFALQPLAFSVAPKGKAKRTSADPLNDRLLGVSRSRGRR
jgi:hypothetical protein